MEILSPNYDCRNPFVAGFLPILNAQTEDQPDGPIKLIDKNLHILVTTTSSQSSSNFRLSTSLKSQTPTKIYHIDISKVCEPRIYQPQLAVPKIVCSTTSLIGNSKSKKALKNKRKKEAKRRRKNQRHVHFPEEDEMIAIIIVVEDDEFIKETRNKYWELFAIDRNRFKHRVQKLSNVIDKVLLPAHRDKIYRERFSDDNEESVSSNNEEAAFEPINESDIESSEKKFRNKKIKKRKKKNKRKIENDDKIGFDSDTESDLDNNQINAMREIELTDSDEDKKDNEISLSITLTDSTVTRFHFYSST